MEKVAGIATRLGGAPEIVCGTIEFRGGGCVDLTPRQSLLPRALRLAGKTEAQSQSSAKNASESKSPSTSKWKKRTSVSPSFLSKRLVVMCDSYVREKTSELISADEEISISAAFVFALKPQASLESEKLMLLKGRKHLVEAGLRMEVSNVTETGSLVFCGWKSNPEGNLQLDGSNGVVLVGLMKIIKVI